MVGPVEQAAVLAAHAVPAKGVVAVVRGEPAQGVQGDQRPQRRSWLASKSQPSGQQASDSQWPSLAPHCCLHLALAVRLVVQLVGQLVAQLVDQLVGHRAGCQNAAGPWHRALENPRFGSQSLRMGRQWVAPYPLEAAEAEMSAVVWMLENHHCNSPVAVLQGMGHTPLVASPHCHMEDPLQPAQLPRRLPLPQHHQSD